MLHESQEILLYTFHFYGPPNDFFFSLLSLFDAAKVGPSEENPNDADQKTCSTTYFLTFVNKAGKVGAALSAARLTG